MSAHERLTELKDRLEAKTRLMQDVAHELKNPLSVIHGYASFLSREEVAPEDMKKALRAIHSNAERLIAMVEQLQDAVRLENSDFAVDTHAVEGAALIQMAAESAELEAARRGIRLRWRSPLGDSLHCVAEPKRVLQVLANLIGNALKFTPPGGSVTIEAGTGAGGGATVRVRDTGLGMTGEEIAVALTPFGQVDASRSRWREGTGLGLPIAKALVQLHGGRLEIRSAKTLGTEVTVVLPQGSEVSDVHRRAAPRDAAHHGAP